MDTESLEAICQRLSPDGRRSLHGSLRIWGHWFGKPYDNDHAIVACTVANASLELLFDEGETLSIWEPRGLQLPSSGFSILSASRVRWEWFYYGRPQIPANRYFLDYAWTSGQMTLESNVDWYAPGIVTCDPAPAAELL